MARGSITIAVTGTYNDRDIKNAIRDLEALQTRATPAAGAFQKLGASFSAMPTQLTGQFLGVAAGIAGVTAAIDLAQRAIVSMITSAADDERAMRSLEIAMANAGQAGHLVATQETIDRLSRMSGVADDQLIPAMRTLINATGSATQAQKLLSLAMDVSAGTGKSVEQVVMALARASNGSTTALSRLGAGIDQATLASGNLDLITDALAQRFTGQAAAAAETFNGKMARFNVAVSEAGEKIGYELITQIELLIESLGGTNGLTSAIDASAGAVVTLTRGAGALLKGITDIINPAGKLGGIFEKYGIDIFRILTVFDPFTHLLYLLGVAAGDSAEAQKENSDAILGVLDASHLATSGLDGLSESTDNTANSTRFAANSFEAMSWAIDNAANASVNLETATNNLNAAIASGSTSTTLAGFFGYIGTAADTAAPKLSRAGSSAQAAGNDAEAAAQKWKTSSSEIATATASLVTAVQGSTTAMAIAPLDSLTTNLGATMTAVTSQMALKADEMGAGMVNAFSARITRLSETVQSAVDKAKQAVDALNTYSKGVVSNVMGNLFQVSTTDQAGNALSPESIFNNILGGADAWQGAAGNIAPFLTKLPEQVATQLYQLPPTQIQAIADYFSANPAMLERLTQRYDELAKWTETNLGIPMAETFAKVGDESAARMLKNARDTIAKSADAFTSFVKSKLATTIDVDVVYHARGAGIPGRASGGPVSASAAYVVGEMGPELFVPNVSGSIIPNSGLLSMPAAGRGGGGNTYSITVQAGIGDPREIGRQVVEVVKAYERASGPVFVSV